VTTLALAPALARLKSFGASWEGGDLIDEGWHLTAGDLDAIILTCEPRSDLESTGSKTVDDLGDLA
jgi:hypothetical protein